MNYESKLIECEKQAAAEIIKTLRTDKKLMSSIVSEIAGELTDEVATPLVMAVLNGDASDLLNRFTSIMYVVIKRESEYKAIAMADQWEEDEEREHAEKRAAMAY